MPSVFLSGHAAELAPYRETVQRALAAMGVATVELTDHATPYGPLQGVLNVLIRDCTAVLHLAGFAYGPEPAERTLGAPRRSFPIYEVDVARALEKPTFFFLATRLTKLAPAPRDDAEAEELQHAHRATIEAGAEWLRTFVDAEELVRHVRELRAHLVVRRRLARLPPALGPQLAGRARALAEGRAAVLPGRVVVFHGPSGAGKTALAVELAWQFWKEQRGEFAFLLPAATAAQLEAALVALAGEDALALVPEEVASHPARLAAVRAWFARPESGGKCVVILDGADAEMRGDFARWLPALAAAAVVITSRRAEWPGARALAVPSLGAEGAREFLAARLPLRAGAEKAELQARDRLAEILEDNPLALTLVVARLRASGETPAALVAEWKPRAHTPRWLGAVAEVAAGSVAQLDPAARALLRMLACFAADPAAIPLAVLENRADSERARASLEALAARGLIAWQREARAVSIHRLIRELVRDALPPEKLHASLAAALGLAEDALAGAHGQPAGWPLCAALAPHCHALLGQAGGTPLAPRALKLTQSLADWLKTSGRFRDAERLYRRALTLDELRLGPADPALARRMEDLATLLVSARRFDEAEPLLRRAIAILEAARGPRDPQLAGPRQQLGALLRSAGRLIEAELHLRRALEIDEARWGHDHPKVAIRLHHLAGLLEARGELSAAEPLYRQALTIDWVAFGETHPKVAVRALHLARLLAARGQPEEAERLLREAVELDALSFGPDHLDVATGLQITADLYEDTGRPAEAATVRRRILAIEERALGTHHPEVAITLNNLALDLENLDRREEARACLARAADILAHDPRWAGRHPHAPSVAANLARLTGKKMEDS